LTVRRSAMPMYEYQCVDCSQREVRVAGLDDHVALCVECGGLMLRLDEDLFQAYFDAGRETQTPAPLNEGGHLVPPLGVAP
jgi:putative FmdB family regulatory protein